MQVIYLKHKVTQVVAKYTVHSDLPEWLLANYDIITQEEFNTIYFDLEE